MEEEPLAWRIWLAVWRTGVQLFYVGLVLIAFSKITAPQSVMITALAGMLYCTIRAGVLGQAEYFTTTFPALHVEIEMLKKKIDPHYESEILKKPVELNRSLRKGRVPIIFQQVGVGVVFLICFFEFWTSLG